MSKTMAINAGSSSLKFQLIEMPQETVVAKGLVERIGLDNSIFAIEYGDDQKFELVEEIATHDRAVELLFEHLTELGIVKDYHEITGAGHRVVAGGELFKESALINDEVIQQVADLGEFAPLHNPAEAAVMRAFKERLPEITMAAVFDTSFHTTMPAVNYLYSLPIKKKLTQAAPIVNSKNWTSDSSTPITNSVNPRKETSTWKITKTPRQIIRRGIGEKIIEMGGFVCYTYYVIERLAVASHIIGEFAKL